MSEICTNCTKDAPRTVNVPVDGEAEKPVEVPCSACKERATA